ncbi:MORN repeat-containing protein 3 isoform X3 [Danio rerio]|uniref:MORN repeat-containing protein 3 isoform X3 n=1 Tax=Danio rerio TaxID=7955 RepID=A0AC58GJY9_DANRE
MPYVKRPPTAEPLVKLWDRKAQKYGLHHTVYSVNGDQYTGEWMDNKKHGKGKQVWKRAGIVYDGDWRCGKRDGFGTLSRMDPETKEYTRVYVGSWRNDKKELMETALWAPGVMGRRTDMASCSSWTEGSCTKASGLTMLLNVEAFLISEEKQQSDRQSIPSPRFAYRTHRLC